MPGPLLPRARPSRRQAACLTGPTNPDERFPGQFAAAASLSGWVDTQALTPVSGNTANTLGPADLNRVWGDRLLDADIWAQYTSTALAPKPRGTHGFLACGIAEAPPAPPLPTRA
ncbi:MAG: hypothetical protein Q8R60_15375 [Mycobacteriales bacterium]|nr:hypothetical protein [Mycobacteriales bacterium]